MKLRWQFGIIAGIFLAIFCLYPQLKLIHNRDGAWNGHYAYNDIDEVAYASYLRALIDGRPRKNDPYTGRDHSAETPQPETLFSIQFAAPYTIAIPARFFGIGTPWAMTIAGGVAAFLSALSVFWFIGRITNDSWYAMAAALGVFSFGTLAAGEGAISEIAFGGISYPYFPGFRRYIPALAFPAFFLFCGCIWKIAGGERGHREQDGEIDRNSGNDWGWIVLGVVSFAYMVFSYFYVWTTAAAFLACTVVVFAVFRPSGWERQLKALGVLSAACSAILVPYAYLLSQRSDSMDSMQLLVYTRVPDLLRIPELIGFAVLVILIGAIVAKKLKLKDPAVLIAIALALVPFVIFNQQVITGRSLQPIHYQVFIGNYVATLALFATIGLFARSWIRQGGEKAKLASAAIFVIAIGWGFVECHYTVRVLDLANEHRDKALPVAMRLEDIVRAEAGPQNPTTLVYDLAVADDLPSVAPTGVLWSHHQPIFATLTDRQNRARLFSFLYYFGAQDTDLDYLIQSNFAIRSSLFGWGRDSYRLTVDPQPISRAEVATVVAEYKEFIAGFNSERALTPEIRYAILPRSGKVDVSNFELWYELDRGEVLGDHVLYRTTPR